MAKYPAPTSPTQRKHVDVPVRRVNARYDAAQTTPDNRRHWAMSDNLDAVDANNADVRNKLRKRSRYEVANNSYAKGITNTLANDTIGDGPRLQMTTGDAALNTVIEAEWQTWARTIRLAAKLRTMRTARAVDGETFGLMFSNQNRFPISLDLRVIEADQIDTPAITEGHTYTQGIEFDKYGQPETYAMLNSHPGGLMSSYGYTAVDAKFMLHWFREDRPGQIRGVPELTAALGLFAQLRRYTLAVLSASEIAAEFTMFLKTVASPDSGADEITDGAFSEVDIERNMLTTLPEGWDVSQLKAEQPATTYEMFQHTILNEIARCLNMPYNIAAGNSSEYNYASGRLDHQTYYRSIGVDQSDAEIVLLDRLLNAFLDEYAFTTGKRIEVRKHKWFWPGREHVDPNKEAMAQSKRLENNTTNLAAEYAAQGKDWETEVAQIAREKDLMQELGLLPTEAAPDAAGV